MIPKNYPKDFVERTLRLINECYDETKSKELEVTFLLNCLLGLIIATNENIENDDYFIKTRLNDSKLIKFIPKSIAQLDFKVFDKDIKDKINKKSLINQLDDEITISSQIKIEKFKQLKNLTLKQFIRFLRNGIAHQNIMPTSNNEHWKGIRIWNHNSSGIKDFEIEFQIGELKKFAIFIGTKFIEKF